jgi:hypothetical protein|tara:strand:- start:1335 stop:2030 length:696 start_codon:yes stop_codon:yes gene_type:complete
MSKVLLTGCGSKYGKVLLRQLSYRYDEIDVISSNKDWEDKPDNVNAIYIDWGSKTSLERQIHLLERQKYDLVFFNHNSKPQRINAESYYVDVLWTQEVLEKVGCHKNLKVGWMITAGVGSHMNQPEFSPYFNNKHSRIYLCEFNSWLHEGVFFTVDPAEPSQWTAGEVKQEVMKLADYMLKDVQGRDMYKTRLGKPPEMNEQLQWVNVKHNPKKRTGKPKDLPHSDPFIYD